MQNVIKAALVALVLSVGFAVPVGAGPLQDMADAIAAYGRGDYATVLRLLRPLAERGHPDAQYSLGNLYHEGRGVPQDYAEAVMWHRKAADQGYARAQYNLGFMYENGRGVARDDAEAVRWYRKSADQGEPLAQNNLGFMYGNGLGVPKDYVQAYMWWTLAASKGHENATNGRDIVAQEMTPEQIAEAQKLAREWRPKMIAPSAGWT